MAYSNLVFVESLIKKIFTKVWEGFGEVKEGYCSILGQQHRDIGSPRPEGRSRGAAVENSERVAVRRGPPTGIVTYSRGRHPTFMLGDETGNTYSVLTLFLASVSCWELPLVKFPLLSGKRAQ